MPHPELRDTCRSTLLDFALTISANLPLSVMFKKSLPFFLNRLDCTLVAAVRVGPQGWDTGLLLPETAAVAGFAEVVDAFLAAGPPEEAYPPLTVADQLFHAFTLPGYGLLILGRRQPLDPVLLAELPQLTAHFARACVACLEEENHCRLEESLQRVQAEQQALLDNLPFLAWLKDAEGRYLAVNEAFARKNGRSRQAIIGQKSRDIWPKRHAQQFAAMERRVFALGRQQKSVEKIEDRDGVWWAETIKAPIFDALGQVVGITSFRRDITEEKRQEDSLRRNESRYRGIVESQSDLVVRVDREGRFTFVNDAYCRAFGKVKEELLGTAFMPLVHEEDLAATMAAMKLLDTPPYRVRIEQRAMTVDGWRWLLWEDYAIKDEQGITAEIQGVGRDITALKSAEQMVSTLNDRLSLAVQAAGIGVWDYDIGGQSIVWDERMYALYGLEKSGEMTYDRWLGCLHPGDRQRCDRQVNLALRGGRELDTEFRAVLPGGESRVLRTRAKVARDGQGGARRMIGVNFDITAQHQMKVQAALVALLAYYSTHFINIGPEEINPTIDAILAEIGRLLDMDRVYVFQLGAEQICWNNTFEWCNEGISPQIGSLQNISKNLLPWWLEKIERFENIVIPEVAALPAEAAAEKAFLQAQQIKSLLVIPLIWENVLEGFIGFDAVRGTRAWTEQDAVPLEMLAGIFINAVKRRETETRLRQSEAELRELNVSLEQKVEERGRQLSEVHRQLLLGEKMAAIGQLAAGVAHELNNPVGFVAMNFETLEENLQVITTAMAVYREALAAPTGSAEQAELLARAADFEQNSPLGFILKDIGALFAQSREGFRRISSIINSMRDFSRTDPREEFSAFDLNQGIRNTLVLVRHIYKNVARVTTELGNLPEVICIAGQVNQVFLNIIVNAAQALAAAEFQQKREIRIRTWADALMAYCEIGDNGPAIPENIRDRLFEPFFTTKPPGQGTGLGLSISYDIIVRKHHGLLSVASDSATGNTFRIALPLRGDRPG